MFGKLCASLPLAACTFALSALAQESTPDVRRDLTPQVSAVTEGSLGPVVPTPEMWFYQQERERADDPKLALRRRAEQRAAERHDRLTALKWYGYSNSRPNVSPTPWFTGYSDHWGSNNYDPQRWRMPSVPMIVTRPIERY